MNRGSKPSKNKSQVSESVIIGQTSSFINSKLSPTIFFKIFNVGDPSGMPRNLICFHGRSEFLRYLRNSKIFFYKIEKLQEHLRKFEKF